MNDFDTLLGRLRRSRTDLLRIVSQVLRKEPRQVWLCRPAVEAWEARDPEAWTMVRSWLEARGVESVIRP